MKPVSTTALTVATALGYVWGLVMTVLFATHHDASSSTSDACGGAVPSMLGTFHFHGTRLTTNNVTITPTSWTQGFASRAIAGTEYCPWQDGMYFMLAVNSPAGLVRRVCSFNADLRTALCSGTDSRDTAVTERVHVVAVDTTGSSSCKAATLGITTWKTFVGGETPVASSFVDTVQAERTSDSYPLTPP